MLYQPAGKWVLQGGSLSVLVDKRATALFAVLVAALCLAVGLCLSVGADGIDARQTVAALSRAGDGIADLIVFEIRLPRIVATLTAGFALGLAGCISQTVFRNRLATPDILGINEGATLAIVAFVLFTATAAWPFWLAPIGACLAVAALYAFGGAKTDQGALLLISGICLMELLRAVVEFMMSTGALHEVQNIYVWLQGSFIGQGYQTSLPVLVVLGLTLPLQIFLAHQLDVLRLPANVAASLGVNVPLLRFAGLAAVAVLAALGASIGGPVAFVAMAAPVLVASLLRHRTPGLWCSGLVGAAILLGSDTLARTFVQGHEVPAGVVTRILGGVFLIYLLMKDGTK